MSFPISQTSIEGSDSLVTPKKNTSVTSEANNMKVASDGSK